MKRPSEVRPHARRAVPAGVLLPVVIFWSTLDRSLILPLVPEIARDLDVSVALAATAITSHAVAYAVLQLLWG
ncbi:MAG: MFS transporter, partial [Microbacterium sp.]